MTLREEIIGLDPFDYDDIAGSDLEEKAYLRCRADVLAILERREKKSVQHNGRVVFFDGKEVHVRPSEQHSVFVSCSDPLCTGTDTPIAHSHITAPPEKPEPIEQRPMRERFDRIFPEGHGLIHNTAPVFGTRAILEAIDALAERIGK